MRDLSIDLARRRAQGLYRTRRMVEDVRGPWITVEGRRLLAFCNNDYLGLAADPRLVAATQEALRVHGVGSGAAHLVCGHHRPHHELEEALAAFTGRSRALLFSTGYMANLGVVTALAGRHDRVYQDRLNHASLLDAARSAQTPLRRYPHGDAQALAQMLAQGWVEQAQGERLIVTDGVFSMDGDLAPLPDLVQLAHAHGAWLMVDDAHGLGVLGPGGRGTLEHFGLGQHDVPILMGTLGKAMGSFGAFVAGSAELIETLIQAARSYVYTTALPPALAVTTLTSLALVRDEPWRREHLLRLVARFRAGAAGLRGVQIGASLSPIQPLILGEATRALAVSEALYARGLWVPAIRPPTVPEGTARLRITLSALHSEAQVDRLLEGLAEALAEVDAART